jgi:hypothetical protein
MIITGFIWEIGMREYSGMQLRLIQFLLACVCLFAAALYSCGGPGSNDPAALETQQIMAQAEPGIPIESNIQNRPAPELPDDPAVSMSELEHLLERELAALGKDPAKTTAAVPTSEDNRVFDLRGRPDTNPLGVFEDSGVTLWWTEVLVGDYDMNGEVGISDLVPIAQYFNTPVSYSGPTEKYPVTWMPTGLMGYGPVTANNWRKSRIDGDHNGKILVSDITPIAQHWGEHHSGYNVYRRGPGETEFSVLPDPAGNAAITAPRSASIRPGNGTKNGEGPVSYSLVDNGPIPGTYTYYVTAVDLVTGEEGRPSNQYSFSYSLPPVASFTAIPKASYDGMTAILDGSASSDPDGTVVQYFWDYGDGRTGSGDQPTLMHIYEEQGNYSITLVVEDDSKRQSEPVSVEFHALSIPVAQFNAIQLPGDTANLLELDASASHDKDDAITEYRYSFWRNSEQLNIPDFVSTEPISQFNFSDVGNTQFVIWLTVTDASGASGTNYSYFTPKLPAAIKLQIWPRDGMAELPVTLSIYKSGSVPLEGSRIDLDFEGDGVYDLLDMQDLSVMHIYHDGGNFTPRARILDAYGNLSTDEDVELIVQPDNGQVRWHETFISGAPYFRNALSLAIVNGNPALSYAGSDLENEPVLAYSRADDPLGLSWSNKQVIDAAIGTQPDRQEGRTQLHVIAGRPAVAYFRQAGNDDPVEFCYVRAQDTDGDQWNGVQVLSSFSIKQESQLSMIELDGQAAIAYSERKVDYQARPMFIRSQNPDGTSWSNPLILQDYNGYEYPYELSLAVINGLPALSFDSGGLSYIQADDAFGNSWGSPVRIALHGGWYNSLAEVDGRPAVSYFRVGNLAGDDSDLYFKRADDATGEEWTPLNHVIDEEGDAGRYSCMAIINGLPSIAYYYGQSDSIKFIQALDSQGTGWGEPEIAIPYGQAGAISLLEYNGLPMIASRSDYGGGAVFAIKR